MPGAKPGGVIQAWGLFPTSDLQATVLLAASGSPSGWGSRTLSELELAALWDVPILVLDLLSGGEGYGILRGFCASAPGKVLFAGTDALLTTSFWGGLVGFNDVVPGPRPKSNEEMGLALEEMGPALEVVKEVWRFDTLVVKGDMQKSDGVAVPDHLWIHAFL